MLRRVAIDRNSLCLRKGIVARSMPFPQKVNRNFFCYLKMERCEEYDIHPLNFLIGTPYAPKIVYAHFPVLRLTESWADRAPLVSPLAWLLQRLLANIVGLFRLNFEWTFTPDMGRTPVSHPLLASPCTPCT